MTDISISLSGVTGVDWPRRQRLAKARGLGGLIPGIVAHRRKAGAGV